MDRRLGLGGVRSGEGRSTGEGRAAGKGAGGVGDGRVRIRATDHGEEECVANKGRRTGSRARGWKEARPRGPQGASADRRAALGAVRGSHCQLPGVGEPRTHRSAPLGTPA